MKRYLVLFALLGAVSFQHCTSPSAEKGEKISNKKSSNPALDQKVDSVLALMTLAEKVGQLNMYNGTWEFTGPVPPDANNQLKLEQIKSGRVGAMLNVLTAEGTREAQKLAVENSRLGIPLLFGYDVIHGYRTMLPVPIAQAASWDYEAAKLGSQVAAREAAAAGQHWTFAPMIDVSPDARWGRIMESAGEDPYLTSVVGKAWIEGYQGDNLADPLTIAACAKHFAGYGFAEAGRDYHTADISHNTLLNVVLPPFKAAAEAGVATFMNSFNDIEGIPATGNAFLQRDVLKGDWGFEGMVVSDWGSIGEMLAHGFAADSADAGRLALLAGSDMDMESTIYEKYAEELVKSGKVSEALIDDAVRRILRLKFQLGLFDDPYRYCDAEREKQELYSAENQQAARDIAQKTIVLLKNEGNLLPLSPSVPSIALIGDLAGSKDIPLGSWRAQAETNSAVSLVEGVQQAAGEQTKVQYAQGYRLTEGVRSFINELKIVSGDKSGFPEAIRLAQSSDVVIMAMGEDCYQTGEGRSQVDVGLKGDQLDLLKEVLKVNKNVIVVLMNGRPLAIPYLAENVPSIVETWFAGSQAGHAIADVLFGNYNPSGKLPVSFPRHTGQEPLYYNQKNTGRPGNPDSDEEQLVFWSHYTDMPNSPQWPFGFGLSYTTFSYTNFDVSAQGNKATVRVTVTNTGQREGTEVAQLYIHDQVASIAQPIKRLVAFERVPLKAGESRELTFTLTEKDLGFYRPDRSFSAESGTFSVMVGGNSSEVLKKEVTLSF